MKVLKMFVNLLTALLLIIGFTNLSNGKPVDDEDTVVIEPAFDNVIDGEDGAIDISHLGPHAYGLPSNESGEFFNVYSFTLCPLVK